MGKYIIAAFVIVFTASQGWLPWPIWMSDRAAGNYDADVCDASCCTRRGTERGHPRVPADTFSGARLDSALLGRWNFLPTMLLMLGNQSMYQKFFSARSEQDARIAVVGWIIGTVILETVIVAIAVFGSALSRPERSPGVHERSSRIPRRTDCRYGWARTDGRGLRQDISTANNYLFSPATNLVNDVFTRYLAPQASNKRVLIVSRLVVVMLGIWALYQALNTHSVLAKTLYAYTIYSAALTPVILAAFYSRRANALGAVSAIAAGTMVTFFWDLGVVKVYCPLFWRSAMLFFRL